MTLKRIFLTLLITVFAVCSAGQPLFATGGVFNEGEYNAQNINFYDPSNGCSNGLYGSANVSSAIANITDTENLRHIFQLLVDGGMNTVQASAVMGNIMQESHFDSGAVEGGTGIGYGLVQWSFGRRTNLEAYAKEKGVDVSDVDMQIEFLFKEYNATYKSRLKGSDFFSNDVSKATDAWMRIFEVPKLAPANDPAAINSVRIPAAVKIYELYNNLSTNNESSDTGDTESKDTDKKTTDSATISPVITTSNCASGNGAVAGNIVQTALNFALETPFPNMAFSEKANKEAYYQATRNTYQEAKPKINPGSGWSDCGGFVATVMRASGVDPDYPLLGVKGSQTPYVRDHPEKYEIIENVSDSTVLQPGDIMMTSGHTIIYTGGSTYPAVDASLNERVPSVQTQGTVQWMINNGTIVARVIK